MTINAQNTRTTHEGTNDEPQKQQSLHLTIDREQNYDNNDNNNNDIYENDAENNENDENENMASRKSRKSNNGRRTWSQMCHIAWNVTLTVLLSQFISLLLCMTGVFSQSLTQFHDISTPTVQNTLSYSALVLFYLPLLIIQKCKWQKAWNTPWYIYPVISLCDSVANYLVVKAYKYTSITSIQLLDCLSIPNVLVLSFLFLRRRYGWVHLSGVLLCIAGVIVVIASEAKVNRGDGGHGISFDKRALLGDLLCVSGSVFYAISNVAQEAVLSRNQKQGQEQEQPRDFVVETVPEKSDELLSNSGGVSVVGTTVNLHTEDSLMNDDSSYDGEMKQRVAVDDEPYGTREKDEVERRQTARRNGDHNRIVNEESPLSPHDPIESSLAIDESSENKEYARAIYMEESLSTHRSKSKRIHHHDANHTSAIVQLADNTIEYLAMVGLFGALYSIAIMLIVERQEIAVYSRKLHTNIYLYLGGFSLSMFGIYSLVPVLLFRASATFMNLSFLSSDLWAMIVSLLIFGGRGVTWMWGLATVLVISGVIIYHIRGDSYRPVNGDGDSTTTPQKSPSASQSSPSSPVTNACIATPSNENAPSSLTVQ